MVTQFSTKYTVLILIIKATNAQRARAAAGFGSLCHVGGGAIDEAEYEAFVAAPTISNGESLAAIRDAVNSLNF